jgi:hypothetical protein
LTSGGIYTFYVCARAPSETFEVSIAIVNGAAYLTDLDTLAARLTGRWMVVGLHAYART